jgi:hypothetical protein
MGEGDGLMPSAPPEIIEKALSLLIPPACREEVLGDLYERCTSSSQYIRESLRVVPMVIFSRIRRTADPQVLSMQATALYISYLVSAWYQGQTSLFADSGLLRLAIPPALIMLGIVVDDAYAIPGKRSILKQTRGPVLGLGFAYLSQLALSTGYRGLALPALTLFYGSAVGLLVAIVLKSVFPPVIDRQAGAGAPALWLTYVAEPLRIPPATGWIVKDLAIVLMVAFVAGQLGGSTLSAYFAMISVMLLIFREVRRRW